MLITYRLGILVPMKRILVLTVLYLGVEAMSISMVQAAVVSISVTDQDGQLLEDAVVELVPQSGTDSRTKITTDSSSAYEVAQRNRTFVPFVSAIRVGSEVDFPNFDQTRHHVYSFSEAKTFELKLYVGRPDATIVFDKTGVVAIGCNIHDYMKAYIYVASSDWLAVTEPGQPAQFNLPDGLYQLRLWHPWQQQPFKEKRLEVKGEVLVMADQDIAGGELTLSLPVEHQDKPAPPESSLQDLFKASQ